MDDLYRRIFEYEDKPLWIHCETREQLEHMKSYVLQHKPDADLHFARWLPSIHVAYCWQKSLCSRSGHGFNGWTSSDLSFIQANSVPFESVFGVATETDDIGQLPAIEDII